MRQWQLAGDYTRVSRRAISAYPAVALLPLLFFVALVAAGEVAVVLAARSVARSGQDQALALAALAAGGIEQQFRCVDLEC